MLSNISEKIIIQAFRCSARHKMEMTIIDKVKGNNTVTTKLIVKQIQHTTTHAGNSTTCTFGSMQHFGWNVSLVKGNNSAITE